MSEPNSKTLPVEHDTTNDVADISTTVEEDTARLLSSKFISRYYLPRRKIDINHSRQCIGPGEQVSAQEKLDELIQLKTDAKQWFRHEVQSGNPDPLDWSHTVLLCTVCPDRSRPMPIRCAFSWGP